MTLGTDSAVVELTGTSMMRVTYDPRLMTLIREARALSSQGVELPREVRDLIESSSTGRHLSQHDWRSYGAISKTINAHNRP